MFGKWFKVSPDTLIFKVAKLKGELEQIEYLQDYFAAKEIDPYKEWWEFAVNMQKRQELKEEHEQISNQLNLLEAKI